MRVPHVHEKSEESFYVLDGTFTFTLAEEDVEVRPGAFILVPRGVPHEMRAGAGGGRLLTLWTPGGLEAMFVELSRDPQADVGPLRLHPCLKRSLVGELE
jgi:quercetin dioxygenase-like cupin family protein